jgi:hypothetical protein
MAHSNTTLRIMYVKKTYLQKRRLEEQVAAKVGVICHSVKFQNDTTKKIKRVMMKLHKDQENAKSIYRELLNIIGNMDEP